MASAREVRLRIKSVKSIAQVTRALQAVSASIVRKTVAAVMRTRPYATKAWQVLTHIARQPGRENLHPLLVEPKEMKNVLVVVITGDRGLAGAYTTNIIRHTIQNFGQYQVPVKYITVGRKGRDMLLRRHKEIIAEFNHLPPAPAFMDVSAIGHIVVDEFLKGEAGKVFLVYTEFINMVKQVPVVAQLLPLEVDEGGKHVMEAKDTQKKPPATYIYEPGEHEILDEIIPRFTALRVYQAILESQASEHAARMVAMKNATDSAIELVDALQLEFNKARQQAITNEMLDIAGGAEAQAVHA
jgi:F-type H+-transporting ATPase subunit gamma